MATRALWRTGKKLALVSTALCAGGAGATIATSDDPATALKLFTAVPVRLVRDSITAASIVFDYEYSLWGLDEGSVEKSKVKHEVHLRSARKLEELCFRNGGIYIKLGQHVGQMEYVETLRASMLNRCPVSSYDQVCQVIKKELGESPDKIFSEFDPTPIASASLAQVHVARTIDGQKVAVKVQHTHMTDTAAADHATVDMIVNTIHRFFPSFDYSVEKSKVKHEVHLRSARKLEELCFRNGGIYIKLGQHVGQMIFSEFDPTPIASASLAQVHVARTIDGQKVAVKVQHTHMTDTAAADHATVDMIVNTIHRFFPSFDYRWLVDEMRESELDFLVEAQNSEKCLDNFRKKSPHIADYVYAPKVYWNLSTSKLLTMEFMDGAHVNDVKAIQRLGIQPKEVAKLVSQAFAEMMFKHGFVHSNLLVRPLPSSKRSILGKRKPQLIILDHGLYKELDFHTRANYAALWKALIFADAAAIKENCVKLGAGEDLYALFAGILTMRPWNKVVDPSVDHLVIKSNDTAIKENCVKLGAGEDLYALFAGILTMRPWNKVVDPSVDHLVIKSNDGDRSELQMYASQYFPQISELLRRLPREILLMLKTNDCLRAVNSSLLQASSLQTFLIIGKVSSEAVIEAKSLQNKSLLCWLNVFLDEILLEVRFFGMQIALWLLQLRKSLAWR
ncbi:putative abc1 protein [Quercus suber]|uniref:Abc1 protein n=1 Tax=Quercus suber TaxID=58331 RepID=A0AAW0KYC4_QUESU